MKNCLVKVERRPMLSLSGIYFQSLGVWPLKSIAVPLDEIFLTDPKLGPQGGFKHAELLHNRDVVWTFTSGDRAFYEEVKEAIDKAKQE
jgi:hypothetical protein